MSTFIESKKVLAEIGEKREVKQEAMTQILSFKSKHFYLILLRDVRTKSLDLNKLEVKVNT